jgi:hypothetical protein
VAGIVKTGRNVVSKKANPKRQALAAKHFLDLGPDQITSPANGPAHQSGWLPNNFTVREFRL